jgi:hypothetical protein
MAAASLIRTGSEYAAGRLSTLYADRQVMPPSVEAADGGADGGAGWL